MNNPPSTVSTCPVMNPASGAARKTTAAATSSGAPKRPSGVCLSKVSFNYWGSASVNRVSMKPGATALTVMPREPTSFAKDFVKPIRPALAAA